jgi:hypothetical protein
MSAALLRNIFAEHKLEDDNESFLHVLAWSTIRFVPSTWPSRARTAHLRDIYDSSTILPDNNVGSQVKADRLLAGIYIPKLQLLQPSPILNLLESLASPFSARYVTPPADTERRIYESIKYAASMVNPHIGAEAYETHRVHQYDLSMQRLTSSKWFIDTMENALAEDGWPEADEADHNLVTPSEGTFNQQRLSAILMSNQTSRINLSTYPTPSSGSSKRSHSPSPAIEPRSKRPRAGTPHVSGNLN